MSLDPTGAAAGMGPGSTEGEAAPGGMAGPDAGESAPAEPPAGEQPSRFQRLRAAAGRRARRLARSKIFWGLVGVALILGAAWERCGIRGCPNVARLASYQPGGASVLLDRRGEPFADLTPVTHAVVEIESLPKHVPAAFIAVEDKRFYRHNGVDWRRVAGAFVANVKRWRLAQGSSTITMQLSRNLYPDQIRGAERTFRRKLLEVRVARDIEKRFSKDEILELYLNHIYFGAGAYGIEAAAKQYFGRSAKDLNLEQAAMLAALPKGPTAYDPRRYGERARNRRDLVLALMAEQGVVDQDRAERARATPIRLTSQRTRRPAALRAAYFVQTVRDMLEDELGEDLYARPLRIRTTIDLRAQRAAEEELERQVRRVEAGDYGAFSGPRLSQHDVGAAQTEYLQGAAVVLENGTGDVLALVGGRDARHSTFNRAVAARRQAGSAFKPFVYAAALARGYAPARLLDDSPYRLVTDGRAWEPNNFDGEFLGDISLRDALVHSRNVPTIRLAHEIGERNVARLARTAGIRAELRESPMIALGIAEVSPLELTAAYTAFSGQGQAVTPRFVLEVKDEKGKTIWQPPVERRRVLDPAHAYMMTDLLRDVVDEGTGRAVRYAGYRGLAAGKTGTTNDGTDTWFVGYTARVTSGIWVGFDKPRAIAEDASGGSVAAFAWGRMMSRIAPWAAGDPWEAPERIVEIRIDPESGLRLADGCVPRDGEATTDLFIRGRAPREICPERAPRPSHPSWGRRLLAWVGDLFDGRGGERLAARERDQDQRRDRSNARETPDWLQPFGAERMRPDPEWPELPELHWQPPADIDWPGDMARSFRDALRERRAHQEEAIDWLRELAQTVEDNLDGDAGREVSRWLDEALRSVQRAASEAQSERAHLEQWLEQSQQHARDARRQRGEWGRAQREEARRSARWN